MAKNEKKTVMNQEVYTVAEFAKIFKISGDRGRTLIRKGDIPAIRIGNQQRIPQAVVNHFFAQATTPHQRGFGMWRKTRLPSITYINNLRAHDYRTIDAFLKDMAEDE
jgi:excisionase family DNA binding protein